MEASRERIAAFAGPRAAAEFAAFDARARVLFDAFEAPVMRNPQPTPLGVAGAVAGRALAVLRALGARPTLAGALDRQFSDPTARAALRALRHLRRRLALPQPGGADADLAGRGGRRLAHRRRDRGAGARDREPWPKTRARRSAPGRRPPRSWSRMDARAGARLADGERIAAAEVLFNGDPAALAAGLMGAAVRPAAPPTPRAARSLSAWVWTFAGAPEGAPLAYHTVFFGADYRREFDALFRRRARPRRIRRSTSAPRTGRRGASRDGPSG